MLVVGCSTGADPGESSLEAPGLGGDPGNDATPVPVDPTLAVRDIGGWGLSYALIPAEGAAFGDVDADGWDDIVISGKTSTFVLRNRGDGSFYPMQVLEHDGEGLGLPYLLDLTGDGVRDLLLSREAGPIVFRGYTNGGFREIPEYLPMPEDELQQSVATYGDFDSDGVMDVYLGRLVMFDTESGDAFGDAFPEGSCPTEEEFEGIIIEEQPAAADALLSRSPDGWIDRTANTGVGVPLYTQAAMVVDLDGDGNLDLLVGTEGIRKDAVYFGDGKGGFIERGVALGMDRETSAMGYDAVDIDNDGDLDVYVTDEKVPDGDKLYLQEADGTFTYATMDRGLHGTTLGTGWGVGFHDLDNDMDLDLFVANGLPLLGCPGGEQLNGLYFNDGTGHFTMYDPIAGSGMLANFNSRAAAFSDIDHDGDLDILVANVDAAPTLLRNDLAPATNSWLHIRLVHPTLSPAVGTRVLVTAGGKTLRRDVKGTYSYGGSSTEVLHFGLGPNQTVSKIEVRWPDGSEQTVGVTAAKQFLTVTKE